jgi:hypothetical protein
MGRFVKITYHKWNKATGETERNLYLTFDTFIDFELSDDGVKQSTRKYLIEQGFTASPHSDDLYVTEDYEVRISNYELVGFPVGAAD